MRLLLISPAEQTPMNALITSPFQASLLRIPGTKFYCRSRPSSSSDKLHPRLRCPNTPPDPPTPRPYRRVSLLDAAGLTGLFLMIMSPDCHVQNDHPSLDSDPCIIPFPLLLFMRMPYASLTWRKRPDATAGSCRAQRQSEYRERIGPPRLVGVCEVRAGGGDDVDARILKIFGEIMLMRDGCVECFIPSQEQFIADQSPTSTRAEQKKLPRRPPARRIAGTCEARRAPLARPTKARSPRRGRKGSRRRRGR